MAILLAGFIIMINLSANLRRLFRRSFSGLKNGQRGPFRYRPCPEYLEDRVTPTTYMVTSTADTGPGTLRQAIMDANSNPGADIIQFQIPGSGVHTIQPATALPQITDPVTIDGTLQTGYTPTTPMIEINGANAGASADGLDISAGNTTVKGIVIDGFGGDGISLFTKGGDTITADFLGIDPTGATAKANGVSGILVLSANNVIGGTTAATRNILSGNGFSGIQINGSGATGNTVEGNFIGTDLTGTKAVANASDGVLVNGGATKNTIGGTSSGVFNVISGNTFFGVQVADAGTNNNLVEGNYVGTDVTGTKAVANASEGIVVSNGAQNNTIGGTTAAARNLVSGNTFSGIQVAGTTTGTNTTTNVVEGNYVGTDVTGTKALANGSDGILVDSGAQNNTIGGTSTGTLNLVSGNTFSGIEVSDAGTNTNVVEGNYVGTDVTGTKALANGSDGILVDNGAQSNTIGGTTTGARNLVSGNSFAGIQVEGTTTGTDTKNNLVEGNYVGTDVTGAKALGNLSDGIFVNNGATNNTIGGSAAGAGNLVSANAFAGVELSDTGTNSNIVAGNIIGTDPTGLINLGNTDAGVLIRLGAQNNQVGGSSALANVIAFNNFSGVSVGDATTTGNSIRANSIYDNTPLGIDLGGQGEITQNQRNGGATGPNNLENYPVIKATSPGASTTISGDYNSLPSTVFTLDFYANPTRDPSFYGQGQTYLGSTTVTTDANGDATFSATLPVATTAGEWVAATATDPNGNTSEFSVALPLPVNNNPVPSTWKPIGPAPVLYGPYSGRVTNAAPDPSNSNIMYVSGENGGIWKTTDWLDPSPVWTPLTDFEPSLTIEPHDLVVFPGNSQIIFAAASAPNGCILNSTNGGTTWQVLGQTTFQDATFSSLVVDPQNANTLYVAVNGGSNQGVFKSTDGGQTWTNLTASTIGGSATDLVMDPASTGSSATLYAGFVGAAGSLNGIWKTTNSGTTWTQLTNGISSAPLFGSIRLALCSSTPADLYATIYDSESNALSRYGTINGGSSWTTLTALPTSEDDRILLSVDPSNPLVVYANGNHDLYQSTDGGTTWTLIAPTSLIDSFVDPQEGYFDDSGAFILADDTGVWRWPGGQNQFERKQGNLQLEQFYNLAVDPTNPDFAYGIALDFPLILKYYGTPVWNQQASSSESGVLLVNPSQPDTIYYYGGATQGQPDIIYDYGGATAEDDTSTDYGFFVSTDAGATFVDENTGLTTTEPTSQTALAEDPSNPSRLLLGSSRVYETTNGGTQWTALPSSPILSSAPSGTNVTHLVISSQHSSTIYASTSDGHFFVSTNDGTSWQEVDSGLSPSPVTSLQLNPNNDQQLFVTTSTDVWETTNGGTTWTKITGNLPSINKNTIAVDWRRHDPGSLRGDGQGRLLVNQPG